jgi:cleavage and polyadenylation specificity factor subunit 1
VAAVREFQLPGKKQSLQRFLGMVNFYRRFLPAAARILKPITDALQGSGGQRGRLTWTEQMKAAFVHLKQLLCNVGRIAHPDQAARIGLATDALDTHVGAVLQQWDGGGWWPLAYYSKKLDRAQSKYSAFGRELLAAYLAVRHFRCMLEGRYFTLLTDHKPLTFALRKAADPWTARQQRQLSFLSEFTSDIQHVAGKEKVVADALSRPSEPACAAAAATEDPAWVAAIAAMPIDYVAMAAAQKTCGDCTKMSTSPSLHVKQQLIGESQLLCDFSTGRARPLGPAAFRQEVFQAMHNLAHPGIRATKRLISARFVWPAMAADVAARCRDCMRCASSK